MTRYAPQPFSTIRVVAGRGASVAIYPSEYAMLTRMLRANAAAERVWPWTHTLDSLRRKRMVKRLRADHPLPIYGLTRAGREAARYAMQRVAQLRERRARRAARLIEARSDT